MQEKYISLKQAESILRTAVEISKSFASNADSESISYNNENSSLSASTIQEAIDELSNTGVFQSGVASDEEVDEMISEILGEEVGE